MANCKRKNCPACVHWDFNDQAHWCKKDPDQHTYTSLTLPEKVYERECCDHMKKAKSRKLSPEQKAARKAKMEWKKQVQQCKHGLNMSYDDAVNHSVPDPPAHRIFKIGDRVRYGGHHWAAIYQVFDEGRYYKLVVVTKEKEQHGSRVFYNLRLTYEPWVDLIPWVDPEVDESRTRLEQDDDLFFGYSQRHMSSLFGMYYRAYGGIDLDPVYQRGNVWTPSQKVNLIHSIFRNIDIGKFTLIKLPFGKREDPAWEMLDGKQRLTAALEFYESRFQYEGKYYHEMHWRDRIHFREYSISYAESNPLSLEQKLRYFLKLNTTGMPVDPDHLTNVMLMLEREKKNNG